jgi:uncharacterized membrane protein YidH (DUF202 family)
MANDDRSTRLVALMAGNGFAFSQIVSRYERKTAFLMAGSVIVAYLALSVLAFAGLGTAYFAHVYSDDRKKSLRLEASSVVAIAVFMLVWLTLVFAGKIGPEVWELYQPPHAPTTGLFAPP